MNDERSIDQLLDAWLDAGPTVAPSRVADAARLEARTTRQMNALERWAERRISTMNTAMRFSLAAAAVAVLAVLGFNVLIAPSIGGEQGPSVSASPSWMTFTSDRYGYSIQHPAEWTVTEKPGDLRLDGMQVGSPGTDEIRPRDSVGTDDGRGGRVRPSTGRRRVAE